MDDIQFTISFDMRLKLTWVDNRLNIIARNSTGDSVLVSTNSNITLIALENSDLLDHIWVAQVMIPHQKLAHYDFGPPIVDESLNIVLKDKDVWVDLWSGIKPTITCPMSFNWFPFDQQKCELVIRVRSSHANDVLFHITVQARTAMQFISLDNQHRAEDYAIMYFQNTLVDYDIKILPPPAQSQQVNIGVRFTQERFLKSKIFFRSMLIHGPSSMAYLPAPGHGRRLGLFFTCPGAGRGTSSSTTFPVLFVSSHLGLRFSSTHGYD